MLTRYLPWRLQSLSNFRYSHGNLLFRAVKTTPALRCNPASRTEVHALVCKRDVNMFLLAAKSFLRHYDDVRVIVHDDGTLRAADLPALRAHIQGIEVIPRKLADQELDQNLPPDLAAKRREHIFLLKLFDFNHFNRGDKTIGFDSDLLFIGEPTQVIEWIERDTVTCFYNLDPTQNTFRALNQTDIGRRVPNFNAGFIGYQGSFSLPTLTDTIRLLGYCLEDQTVFAYLFAGREPRPLDRSRYYVYDGHPPPEEAVMVHFISPFRFKDALYGQLCKRVTDELRLR